MADRARGVTDTAGLMSRDFRKARRWQESLAVSAVSLERIQWAQSNSSGVRSWAYHGIGKVHLAEPGAWKTLCGRQLPSPSKRFAAADEPAMGHDCKQCARKAEA